MQLTALPRRRKPATVQRLPSSGEDISQPELSPAQALLQLKRPVPRPVLAGIFAMVSTAELHGVEAPPAASMGTAAAPAGDPIHLPPRPNRQDRQHKWQRWQQQTGDWSSEKEDEGSGEGRPASESGEGRPASESEQGWAADRPRQRRARWAPDYDSEASGVVEQEEEHDEEGEPLPAKRQRGLKGLNGLGVSLERKSSRSWRAQLSLPVDAEGRLAPNIAPKAITLCYTNTSQEACVARDIGWLWREQRRACRRAPEFNFCPDVYEAQGWLMAALRQTESLGQLRDHVLQWREGGALRRLAAQAAASTPASQSPAPLQPSPQAEASASVEGEELREEERLQQPAQLRGRRPRGSQRYRPAVLRPDPVYRPELGGQGQEAEEQQQGQGQQWGQRQEHQQEHHLQEEVQQVQVQQEEEQQTVEEGGPPAQRLLGVVREAGSRGKPWRSLFSFALDPRGPRTSVGAGSFPTRQQAAVARDAAVIWRDLHLGIPVAERQLNCSYAGYQRCFPHLVEELQRVSTLEGLRLLLVHWLEEGLLSRLAEEMLAGRSAAAASARAPAAAQCHAAARQQQAAPAAAGAAAPAATAEEGVVAAAQDGEGWGQEPEQLRHEPPAQPRHEKEQHAAQPVQMKEPRSRQGQGPDGQPSNPQLKGFVCDTRNRAKPFRAMVPLGLDPETRAPNAYCPRKGVGVGHFKTKAEAAVARDMAVIWRDTYLDTAADERQLNGSCESYRKHRLLMDELGEATTLDLLRDLLRRWGDEGELARLAGDVLQLGGGITPAPSLSGDG